MNLEKLPFIRGLLGPKNDRTMGRFKEVKTMKNLLKETEAALKKIGKDWADVCFIQNESGSIQIDEFKRQANKEYDNGYGSAEVDLTLVIVGPDWWLERSGYDGSEWWELKTLPEKIELSSERTIWNSRYMNEKPEASE